jgi:hypothetical protein
MGGKARKALPAPARVRTMGGMDETSTPSAEPADDEPAARYTATGHRIVANPDLKGDLDPDDVWVEINGVVVPEIHPDLRAGFDEMDARTAGMSAADLLAALNGPDGGAALLGLRPRLHLCPEPD